MHLRTLSLLALVALLLSLAPACDETSVVLLIRSKLRIPQELDAICLQLAAGNKFQFGHRYPLGLEQAGVPLSISVLPGSQSSFEAMVRGERRGLEVAWVRAQFAFVEHEVQKRELFLRCGQRRGKGLFSPGGPLTKLPGAVVAGVPIPGFPSETVVVSAEASQRFAYQEDQVVELLGGLPPSGTAVRKLLAVDVDGDCDQDLVLLQQGGPQLWIHGEKGTFQLQAGAIPLTGDYHDLATADLNLDGFADLVLVSPTEVKLLLNNGQDTGTFRDHSEALPAGLDDVTAVGIGFINKMPSPEKLGPPVTEYYPDIVLGRGSTTKNKGLVLINRFTVGNLTFDKVELPEERQTSSLAVGDLDGDGAHDVVLGNVDDLPQVYLNTSTADKVELKLRKLALINVSTDTVEDVLTVDVDDDCDLDVVLARPEGIAIYLNDGKGSFLESKVGGDPLRAERVTTIDVDGDQVLDIVVAGAAGAAWLRQEK